MSVNKDLVTSYLTSRGTEYARFLTDDIELVHWDSGVPASGALTRGKETFVKTHGSREGIRIQISRMTEEGNVVVAEGFARGTSKEGRNWTAHFCDIFEIEHSKVKRISAHTVGVTESP